MTGKTEFISRAKLNWVLRVGPPRSDGYHDLLTVFQELEAGERIEFESMDRAECHLTGYPADIPAESNLVTRAWQLMRVKHPREVGGLKVNVDKQLPRGGGLGGGSSNAACTLQAINQLYGLQLSPAELELIGGQIGSDVAFFVRGGVASATGRGEILSQLPEAPRYYIVLVVPEEPMSTAEGYRLLDEIPRVAPSPHMMSDFLTALYSGDPAQLAAKIRNDFELVAERYSWYEAARNSLSAAGALKTFLCGSGSTVAGLCADSESAQRIALQVGGILTHTWCRRA